MKKVIYYILMWYHYIAGDLWCKWIDITDIFHKENEDHWIDKPYRKYSDHMNKSVYWNDKGGFKFWKGP